MRGRRRGPSFGIVVFRIAYWTVVALVALLVYWLIPRRATDGVFNRLTFILYVIAAAGIYRLLLLFAMHASGSDAVEREIRESEGRVELKLDDRDDGWGA
jgi:hypothetical protein